MAVQLAEMSASDAFHPEQYRDEVHERVRGLIQRKIEGEEITNAFADEPKAQVIDLMEALRRSLGGASAKPAPAAKSAAAKPVSKLPIKPKAERKAPKQAPRAKVAANSKRAR
jgi:DNA end-binding protein Ku